MDSLNSFLVIVTNSILSPIYQLAVGIALLYFLWGGVKFIYNMNNPDEREKSKQHLLWGIIGLFILFSIGGIFAFFETYLGGMFK
jgi:heme O synthase-like polyprenyltransferase